MNSIKKIPYRLMFCLLFLFGMNHISSAQKAIPESKLIGDNEPIKIMDFNKTFLGQYKLVLNFYTTTYGTVAKMKADVYMDNKTITVTEYSHFASKKTNDPVLGNKTGTITTQSEAYCKFKIYLSGNTLYLEQIMNPSGGKVKLNASSWKLHSRNSMRSGSKLFADQKLISESGIFHAIMQDDGNFVVYPGEPYIEENALWSTKTYKAGESTLELTTNGTLILKPKGKASSSWDSNTIVKGSSTLILSNDGQLILYYGGGAFPISPKPKVKINENPLNPDTTFVMVFASDPQLGYEHIVDDTPPYDDNLSDQERENQLKDHYYINYIVPNQSALVANQWHSASIQTLKKQVLKDGIQWEGVVINGDMTNTRDDNEEYPDFKRLYLDKFRVYPGLGNHEHDEAYFINCNNVGETGENHIIGRGVCDKRVHDRFVKTVLSLPKNRLKRFDYIHSDWERKGSRAYSWTIGNYHFIQLNNNPAFEHNFELYNSARVGNETYSFSKSFDWLEEELEMNKDKKIILNMHGISVAWYSVNDNFSYSKYGEDWKKFLNILDKHPNVVAIFAGHIHNFIGQMKCYWNDTNNKGMRYTRASNRDDWTVSTSSGRKIDVFFGGSAEWAHYLKVTFHPNKLVVEPIHSANGYIIPTSNRKIWTVNH